jgi:hypothetical protein
VGINREKQMNKETVYLVTGIALVVFGPIFGLYMGVWWAFIGGIAELIEAVRAVELVPLDVASGIAKIMFAAPIGLVSALIPMTIGSMLYDHVT